MNLHYTLFFVDKLQTHSKIVLVGIWRESEYVIMPHPFVRGKKQCCYSSLCLSIFPDC